MIRNLIKSVVDGIISIECRLTPKKNFVKKRVLIFRKDGLGDYIVFYPFLSYFRTYYRDYRITLVIPKVAHGLTPLLKGFDEIIEFDAKKFGKNFSYRRAFIKHLATQGFEIAIYPVYTREDIADLIIKLTRAPKRIGIWKAGNNSMYTDLVKIPKTITKEIEIDTFFTEQCIGDKITVSFPTIDISIFDNTRAHELLYAHNLIQKKFCVIFPGAASGYRKWPEDRFAAICDHLYKHKITPVICGGNTDKTFAGHIIGHATHHEQIVDLTGKTDIPTLAHILNASLFYFGNETGALHLAVALNIPTVCILGGGVFGRFFPYGNAERNKYAFDKNMKCKGDYWKCSEQCKGDERAPCIIGITLENAKGVVDTMLQYLSTRQP